MSKYYTLLYLSLLSFLISCGRNSEEHRVVLCIPVYGQSLALGEEAERITDFDSLANYADGRIVTENLDHHFGYFENDELKEFAKKLVGYQKRAFELSVYNMAKVLADATGGDTLICIFPGGQGATAIANLSKGTAPYQKFIKDIQTAYEEATERGLQFVIPAICWMQGESDIVDYPDTDYRQMLQQIRKDMNDDINRITHQEHSIPFVCYQANSLSRAEHFNANSFKCPETDVPQVFVDLLHSDSLFWASGPTYPYTCVNEKIHIDAIGQQSIGALAAKSVLSILRGKEKFQGLIPLALSTNGNSITIRFHVPTPPLVLDTILVRKADHYGFSVINQQNQDIAETIVVDSNTVTINCTESPAECRIRYAVGGDYMKSGNQHGPRGNLRDSQGDVLYTNIKGRKYPLHNWCYQFDITASHSTATYQYTWFRHRSSKRVAQAGLRDGHYM